MPFSAASNRRPASAALIPSFASSARTLARESTPRIMLSMAGSALSASRATTQRRYPKLSLTCRAMSLANSSAAALAERPPNPRQYLNS